MNKTNKDKLANCIKEYFSDEVFSLPKVCLTVEGVTQKAASAVFVEWRKHGGIVVVGKYPRKQGGSPHSLFRVSDMDVIFPKVGMREQYAERLRKAAAEMRNKCDEDNVIGARIQSFTLGLERRA